MGKRCHFVRSLRFADWLTYCAQQQQMRVDGKNRYDDVPFTLTSFGESRADLTWWAWLCWMSFGRARQVLPVLKSLTGVGTTIWSYLMNFYHFIFSHTWPHVYSCAHDSISNNSPHAIVHLIDEYKHKNTQRTWLARLYRRSTFGTSFVNAIFNNVCIVAFPVKEWMNTYYGQSSAPNTFVSKMDGVSWCARNWGVKREGFLETENVMELIAMPLLV